MTKEKIMQLIEEEDVEFIRLQFADINGNLKNVAVTSVQFANVLDYKCGIEGAALTGLLEDNIEDLYLVPDLDTFQILPWRPQSRQVARLLCDVYHEDGTLCMSSPRAILKKVLNDAAKQGYTIYIDPECEFFLYHTDESGMPTTVTHDQAGYLDVGPVDLGENARRDMVLALEDMGFRVESSHHEQAPAQHEIDFGELEALGCADAIMTFRNTVRSIAKRFGLHATFMPKPKEGVAGSGMHLKISVYKDNRNIFNSQTVGEIKDEAKWFIGGIFGHANAICAMSNPLVNSYKRLCSGFDAPLYRTWSTKSMSSLIQVRRRPGEDTKLELRFPDSAANPYTVIAAAVLSGLDGISNKIDPGSPIMDVKDDSFRTQENKLPNTLVEAVDKLDNDNFLRAGIGDEYVDAYVSAKNAEWNAYMQQVSNWEIEKYLYKL